LFTDSTPRSVIFLLFIIVLDVIGRNINVIQTARGLILLYY